MMLTQKADPSEKAKRLIPLLEEMSRKTLSTTRSAARGRFVSPCYARRFVDLAVRRKDATR